MARRSDPYQYFLYFELSCGTLYQTLHRRFVLARREAKISNYLPIYPTTIVTAKQAATCEMSAMFKVSICTVPKFLR